MAVGTGRLCCSRCIESAPSKLTSKQARTSTRPNARPPPQVLEALAEIAFAPQFLPTRVEKERKAVLAEAQVGAAAAAARRAAY